jgi:hypothetical protein
MVSDGFSRNGLVFHRIGLVFHGSDGFRYWICIDFIVLLHHHLAADDFFIFCFKRHH